jgi:hypothetical protein
MLLASIMGGGGGTEVNQTSNNTASLTLSTAINSILGGGTAGGSAPASSSQSTTASQPSQSLNPGVSGYNGLFDSYQLGQGTGTSTSLGQTIASNGAYKMLIGLGFGAALLALIWFFARK